MKTSDLSFFLIAAILTATHISTYGQETVEKRYEDYLKFYSFVGGTNVRPHWYPDGNTFWFARSAADSTVIYKVDPKLNTKTVLFDILRLRNALTSMLGHSPLKKGVPFSDFNIIGETGVVQFIVEEQTFRLDMKDYTIKRDLPALVAVAKPSKTFSPDRQRFAFVEQHNLWAGNSSNERATPLTDDGTKDYAWDIPAAAWSPDGAMLLVKRQDARKVHHLPIVDYSTPIEQVDWATYAKVGGALEITELFVFNVQKNKYVRIDTGIDTANYIFPLGWRPDGTEIIFMRLTRTGNKLELLAGDPRTGVSRIVITELQKTFVAGLDFITTKWQRQFTMLNDSKRFIWMSERDGWRHLYLYDMNGKLIRRLTAGTFPVTEVIKLDEKSGWIYFNANAENDLYATNLYHIDFMGKKFKKLTAASGPHYTQFAPSGNFFIDTHSSPDRPPTSELRNANGSLLQIINGADISKLSGIGFKAPESFVVKAADGTTDLYGILYKPFNFDPSKKYPVVEFIYAGPFITIVPKGFMPGTSLAVQAQALAQLGYVTFLLDGRGTPERSKAFQDVVYRNISNFEIKDHVAALKQLVEKRTYMDPGRVGIYGHSWGGYFAVHAMLAAPEVYHVGIASAPGELTEGAEIMEPYMDLPANNKAGYEAGTNTNLASNLKGKLLFIHGTSDVNAPLSTSIRMIDALIKAGKPYDLILLPGQSHFFQGIYDKYSNEAIRHYFERNLK